MTFDCSGIQGGNYIIIRLPGNNQVLTLCEVQVCGTLSPTTEPTTEAFTTYFTTTEEETTYISTTEPISNEVSSESSTTFVPSTLDDRTSQFTTTIEKFTLLSSMESTTDKYSTLASPTETIPVTATTATLTAVANTLIMTTGDVDECNQGLDNCNSDATCTNTVGGYNCTCNDGYTGDGREDGNGCNNIDECNEDMPCDTKADCTDTIGFYTCICQDGYEGTGLKEQCHDINECVDGSHQCGGSSTCINTVPGYNCTCESGYELAEDLRTCQGCTEKLNVRKGYSYLYFIEEDELQNPIFDLSSLVLNKLTVETYTLDNSKDSASFVIDSLSGAINTTLDHFDHELKGKYELEINLNTTERNLQVLVIIEIEDINDHSPVFTNAPYESVIMEYAPVGSFVAVVIAIDEDDSETLLSYFIDGSTAERNNYLGSLFVIDNTGRITVQGVLNRQRLNDDGYLDNDQVLIPVSASDGELTSSTTVFLKIEPLFIKADDVNKTKLIFSLLENSTVGKIVADVGLAVSGAAYTYKIIGAGAYNDFSFAINETTGEISLVQLLDREERDTFIFSVIVLENQCLSGTESFVTITIDDINDNIPIFTETSYLATVREDAGSSDSLDTVVVIPQILANDNDVGINADIRYSLSGPGSDKFLIDPKSGALRTIGLPQLDYESTKEYSLVVTATDMDGDPLGNSQSVPLKLSISDVNDNKPVFDQALWNLTIPEDVPPGTIIATIAATDVDDNLNGEIMYYILDGSDGKFRVDAVSGELSILSMLDTENKEFYEMTVAARDQGFPVLEATVNVVVMIMDVNDNVPKFDRQFYNVHIFEEMVLNHEVRTITATDPDKDENGSIIYSITDSSKFAIDENGTISALERLDRETTGTHDLIITATDRGTPPLSSSTQVRVVLDDINDNSPEFSREIYSATLILPPNSIIGAGTLVTSVSATDKDIGSNAELIYSVITQTYTNFFGISDDDAVVVVKEDFPVIDDVVTFTIGATDGGLSTSDDNAMVTITFVRPSQEIGFNETEYKFEVEENSLNTYIGRVQAYSAKNTQLQLFYYLPFNIDAIALDNITGVISTTGVLDRESSPQMKFNVLARSHDEADGFAFSTVEIKIVDLNDEVPEFTFPVDPVYVLEPGLYENTLSQSLITLNADDKDAGLNAVVEYAIIGGNEDDIFGIDNSTGSLQVIKEADREYNDHYDIIVLAKDHGENPLNSTVAISIDILDKNDNAPNITSKFTETNILENILNGTEVAYITSTDDDIGDNAAISYQLLDDSDAFFNIDAKLGSIRTAKTLDRETKDIHTISVVAIDNGSPIRMSSTALFIAFIVDDSNDNAPQFQDTPYYAPIPKDSPVRSLVFQVLATDEDIGNNKVLSYNIIVGGNCSHDAFEINSTTGELRTTHDLYGELSGSCTIVVRCVDNGTEPLASTTTVEVDIIEVNYPPRFQSHTYKGTIAENAAIGDLVHTTPTPKPKAVDNDVGSNAEIIYEIIDGNDADLFSINHQTGEISVKNVLDRETIDFAAFTITAHDATQDPKSATANVSITIGDVNDNGPKLPREQMIVVPQSSRPGFTVVTLNASDADLGRNAECSYSFANVRIQHLGSVPPEDYFALHPTQGMITTKANLYNLNLTSTIILELIVVADNIVDILSGWGLTSTWLTVLFTFEYTPSCRQSEYYTDLAGDSPRRSVLDVIIEPLKNGTKPIPKLLYNIQEGNIRDGFVIDVDTGVLSVNDFLDVRMYNLTITVKTEDPANGIGSCYVLIDVQPVPTTTHTVSTVTRIGDNQPECVNDNLIIIIVVSTVAALLFILLVTIATICYWLKNRQGLFKIFDRKRVIRPIVEGDLH
ncbi:protocadherin Fat 4-like [Glandiceps talaboti]